MAKRARCPPGVWCLTPSLGWLLAIGVVLLVAVALFGRRLQAFIPDGIQTFPIGSAPAAQPPVHILNHVEANQESRYARAPEPLRNWLVGPDLRGAIIPPGAVPINVSPRGIPEQQQQMGIVKSGEQVLPLQGRRTTGSNSRYQYQTRTDTFNPVQVPIRLGRRDCTDSVGCDELLGGEKVHISGLGKEGKVEIYQFDGPTYIPGLV